MFTILAILAGPAILSTGAGRFGMGIGIHGKRQQESGDDQKGNR